MANAIKKYMDGDYCFTEYDNGAIEQSAKESNEIITEPEPTQLDRIEEAVTNTALTTEYMACLQEINS